MLRRRSMVVVAAAIACVLSLSATAQAATPVVVWAAPGMGAPAFSLDGSLALTIANTSAGGRLEIRRAATGVLVRAVTNPVKFGSAALSGDNQLVAVSLNSSPRVIRLLRVSDGALVRSIPTVAARDLSSIDFSPDGLLIAAADKRSYERTRRAARCMRISDWASVLTRDDGALLLRWSSVRGSAIWVTNPAYLVPTSLRLISVPDRAVVRSVALQAWEDSVSDVSNDDSLVLSGRGHV